MAGSGRSAVGQWEPESRPSAGEVRLGVHGKIVLGMVGLFAIGENMLAFA